MALKVVSASGPIRTNMQALRLSVISESGELLSFRKVLCSMLICHNSPESSLLLVSCCQ